MSYTIQTHGTGGKWNAEIICRQHWADEPAKNIEEALEVCRRIKNNGYGVRLFENGVLVMSTPWQVKIELGIIGEI